MKKYSKPVISVTVINSESIITLSGTGVQALSGSDTKKTRDILGLNS